MPAKVAGYKIELLINGEPMASHDLVRHHRADVPDRTTLTGTAKLILQKGDQIGLRLTVEELDGRRNYIVLADGTTLKAERMRNW